MTLRRPAPRRPQRVLAAARPASRERQRSGRGAAGVGAHQGDLREGGVGFDQAEDLLRRLLVVDGTVQWRVMCRANGERRGEDEKRMRMIYLKSRFAPHALDRH